MPNYSTSVLYKISYNNIIYYIGSTTNFNVRRNSHKKCCNNSKYKDYNQPLYVFIRANGGWNSWSMEIIENFPCKNKNELLIKETYWYDMYAPQLNIRRPLRTKLQQLEARRITDSIRRPSKKRVLLLASTPTL